MPLADKKLLWGKEVTFHYKAGCFGYPAKQVWVVDFFPLTYT